jgi:hypothetical protein
MKGYIWALSRPILVVFGLSTLTGFVRAGIDMNGEKIAPEDVTLANATPLALRDSDPRQPRHNVTKSVEPPLPVFGLPEICRFQYRERGLAVPSRSQKTKWPFGDTARPANVQPVLAGSPL